MYFSITSVPVDPNWSDPHLSYLLAKHPDSVFDREVCTGCKVIGKFSTPDTFEISVQTDPVPFMEVAKKQNMPFYVHNQLSAVCPHSLRGVDTCLRSALRANFNLPDEIKEAAEPERARMLKALIGPFPCPTEVCFEFFEAAGFSVSKLNYELTVQMLELSTSGMPLAEFLQKIYIISFYLTRKCSMFRAQDDQISKFASFCTGWIDQLGPLRNKLINGLSGFSKKHIKLFEEGLMDESEPNEERKEFVESLFETRTGLHQRRHQHLIDWIQAFQQSREEAPQPATGLSALRVVELGCGGGSFINRLDQQMSDIEIVGIESSLNLCNRIIQNRRKHTNDIEVVHSNISVPNLRDEHMHPHVLVCTEVLEHLTESSRAETIHLIKDFWQAQIVLITVPDIRYNIHFSNLEDNGLRHPDHKIEFDLESLEREILAPLREIYQLEVFPLPVDDKEESPSFLIWGSRKTKLVPAYSLKRRMDRMYHQIYLPASDYSVSSKELAMGYTTRAYQENVDHIFYLGPTMSPVDYSSKVPDYLEHPLTAMDYYAARGETMIWQEKKYMGSRGYILAFRSEEVARSMGYSRTIVNSRGGFPFFDRPDQLKQVEDSICWEHVPYDFMVLDCEILPWCLKAESMIIKDFINPGVCALYSRRLGQYGDIDAAEKYLKALSMYTFPQALEVRVFDILAAGKVKETSRGFRFDDVTIGHYKRRSWHYNTMAAICSGIVKPVEYRLVYTDSPESIQEAVDHWTSDCETGAEGSVFKTNVAVTHTANGYYIQPAMKVRGRDYLRIIYGIDYLTIPEYFSRVCHRSTTRKRKMAIQDFELSLQILRSFLTGNRDQKRRLVSGFLGHEGINYSHLDATL